MSELQSVPPPDSAAPLPPQKTSRRKVLKVAAVAAAGVAVGVATPAVLNRRCSAVGRRGGDSSPLPRPRCWMPDAARSSPRTRTPGRRPAWPSSSMAIGWPAPAVCPAVSGRAGIAGGHLPGPSQPVLRGAFLRPADRAAGETGAGNLRPRNIGKSSPAESFSSWFAITPCRASTAARATAATRITSATACLAWRIPTSSGRTVTAVLRIGRRTTSANRDYRGDFRIWLEITSLFSRQVVGWDQILKVLPQKVV